MLNDNRPAVGASGAGGGATSSAAAAGGSAGTALGTCSDGDDSPPFFLLFLGMPPLASPPRLGLVALAREDSMKYCRNLGVFDDPSRSCLRCW